MSSRQQTVFNSHLCSVAAASAIKFTSQINQLLKPAPFGLPAHRAPRGATRPRGRARVTTGGGGADTSCSQSSLPSSTSVGAYYARFWDAAL